MLTTAGLVRYRRTGGTGLLSLAFGTYVHLILDGMWQTTETLLWPLYGFAFPRLPPDDWLGRMWDALLHVPSAYIPELVGAAVLVLVLWVLLRRRALRRFARRGRL